jgi:hypothetical protein
MKKEENVGLIFGAASYIAYYWTISKYVLRDSPILYTQQTGYSQIGNWLIIGPIVIFLTIFPYLMSKKVIDEERKIEYIAVNTSYIVGFFVWFTVVTLAYSLNIEIGYIVNGIGGYLTMLLIYYLYVKKNLSKLLGKKNHD